MKTRHTPSDHRAVVPVGHDFSRDKRVGQGGEKRPLRQRVSGWGNGRFAHRLMRVVLALAILLPIVAPTIQSDEHPGDIEEMRTISYYPRHYSWLEFWPNWDDGARTAMLADLDKIKALGFNTVRIFVNPVLFADGHGEAQVKLNDALNLIESKGLKAHVNVFDCFYDYDTDRTKSQKWIDALVTKNDSRVALWELINEPLLFKKDKHGNEFEDVALQEWIADMYPYLNSKIGENGRATISLSDSHVGDDWKKWIDKLNELTGPDGVDVFSVHWYPSTVPDISRLHRILAEVKSEIGEVELMLGETGASAYTFSEEAQARLMYDTLRQIDRSTVPHIGVWTMYDFPSGIHQCSTESEATDVERAFGVYRDVNDERPVANVLRILLDDGLIGGIEADGLPAFLKRPFIYNGSFEHLNPLSGEVNDWASWDEDWDKARTGERTFVQDCTNAHTGKCSARITTFNVGDAKKREVVGIRAFPGITVDPDAIYQLSGFVKTEGLDGRANLAIAWYDSNEEWLDLDTDSNVVTTETTAGWQVMNTPLVQAPVDAAYLIVFAKVYSNNDEVKVYFDDISLSSRPVFLPKITR